MTDPIFTNAGAVQRHDDVVEIVGAAPGPAGFASARLRDATVSVDYADPGLLVGITVPADRAAGNPIFEELLGSAVAAQVDRYLATGQRSLRPIGVRGNRRGVQATSLDPVDLARAAGTIVVLADRADDPDRTALERVAAALDVAALDVAALGALVVFRPVFAEHDRLARELLEECGDELVAAAQHDPELFELLTNPPYRWALPDDLHAALGSAPWSEGAILDVVQSMASDRAMSLPRLTAPVAPRVSVHGGVWTVTVVAHDYPEDETWVRVLAADQSLLAAAPMRLRGQRLVAELALPPGLEPADATIAVTTDPFPVTTTSALGVLSRAVRTGRRAADHATAGHLRRSATAWAACATLWAELGDDDRAAAALRRRDASAAGDADDGRRAGWPLPDRLLTDLVVPAA